MPDILIRDVDIPTRSDVLIHIYPDGKGALYPFLDKPRKVDVAELPAHGRLKDCDYIINEYSEWFKKTESPDYKDMFYMLWRIVNSAPVIVPASEEATNDSKP